MKRSLLAGSDSKSISSESTHFSNECNTFYYLEKNLRMCTQTCTFAGIIFTWNWWWGSCESASLSSLYVWGYLAYTVLERINCLYKILSFSMTFNIMVVKEKLFGCPVYWQNHSMGRAKQRLLLTSATGSAAIVPGTTGNQATDPPCGSWHYKLEKHLTLLKSNRQAKRDGSKA